MAQKIDYLRISVTDRCNFNCIYCLPRERTTLLPREEIMSYEEMAKIVKACVSNGIRRVRLTGGEPFTKRGIENFVRQLKNIPGLEEVSLTTNGVYLQQLAIPLKRAGLDRINISLDTLQPERFRQITGYDSFAEVWAGVEEALRCGLNPVKLNVVLLKGVNDDEWQDFVKLVFRYPLSVRFVEFFPLQQRFNQDWIVRNNELKEKIQQTYGLLTPAAERGSGPAQYFTLPKVIGTLGFISGYSQDFCGACNRLRMNAVGKIFPCLFSDFSYDVKDVVRSGASDDQLEDYIKTIFNNKGLYTKNNRQHTNVEMSSIGG